MSRQRRGSSTAPASASRGCSANRLPTASVWSHATRHCNPAPAFRVRGAVISTTKPFSTSSTPRASATSATATTSPGSNPTALANSPRRRSSVLNSSVCCYTPSRSFTSVIDSPRCSYSTTSPPPRRFRDARLGELVARERLVRVEVALESTDRVTAKRRAVREVPRRSAGRPNRGVLVHLPLKTLKAHGLPSVGRNRHKSVTRSARASSRAGLGCGP